MECHHGGLVLHDPRHLRCKDYIDNSQLTIVLQVIAASVGRAFGPDYFAPNFGLFFTSTAAYFIIIIIVSQVCCRLSYIITGIFTKQVKVMFDLIGYSGMFLMAGAIGACGVVVTFLMADDIKYERVKKENAIVKA